MSQAVPLMNLANRLTILRLILAPIFMWTLLASSPERNSNNSMRVISTVLFLVASLTDFADGYVARRQQIETNFGKIADPIADKLLIGSALFWLSLQGLLWWWVTVAILFREVGITIYRFLVIKRGVIAASRGGKAKTVSQILAITLYLLPLPMQWVMVAHLVMAVAFVLTVATGIDYLVQASRMKR